MRKDCVILVIKVSANMLMLVNRDIPLVGGYVNCEKCSQFILSLKSYTVYYSHHHHHHHHHHLSNKMLEEWWYASSHFSCFCV